MKNNLKLWSKSLTLLIIWIGVQVLIMYAPWFRLFIVEYYYHPVSTVALQVFNTFKFPFGEVYYILLIIAIIIVFIRTFALNNKYKVYKMWRRVVSVLLLHGIIISLQWSPLYYNVPPVSKNQIGNESEMSEEEWIFMYHYLLERIDLYYLNQVEDYQESEILSLVQNVFSVQCPQTKDWLIKKSYFSIILQKMGISGYYNPFTFETYINGFIPKTVLPFVALHELAHQAGVAKEGQANLLAYEYGVKSGHSLLASASYFQALLYVNAYLKTVLPDEFNSMWAMAPKGIQKAYEQYLMYWKQNRSFLNKLSTVFFDSFLKVQGEKEGVATYVEFIEEIYKSLAKEHKMFEQTI